jgi:rubrerythrin
MKDKPTLPITMKKQDMIEEYETLYHNYKGKEQTINIQATYIGILMNMLLKQGVTQKEINNALDGNKVFYKVEKIREERINNNILREQLKIEQNENKRLGNRIKRLESRERPKKVLEVSKEEFKESGYKYCCPKCKMLVGTITKYGDLEEDDYCPSCGQKLNWSENNE